MKRVLNKKEGGFTLIELLIVIVFMSILGSLGVGYYFNYYRETVLKSNVEKIGAFLYDIQQKSIGQEESSNWGVHFENPVGQQKSFYASFKGTTYTEPLQTNVLDEALDFEYPADGQSVDIVFSKINGKVLDNQYKKVYLKLNNNGSVRAVRVAPTGVISIDEAEVGYWKMDEGSGTLVLDKSIYRSNATFVGSPVWKDEASCRNLGKCLSFSSGNYLTIGDEAQLKLTGNQSIAMWLKPASFATRQNPYAKAYGGEGTIVQETGGALNYYYGTGGGNSSPYESFGSVALPLNQWSHAVIVRDFTNMKLSWYINGVLTNTKTPGFSNASVSTLPAYIGHGYVSDYVGDIDDVRIYDRALSPSEVSYIYESTK